MAGVNIQQLLVAGSSLLAALPVGCSVGYPGVLLQQLNLNDSSIQLDWDTASWIGSIHGIAGIPSILMPVFMQWRGRKLAFILACLVSIIGWIVAYTATTTTSILISESIHGFGSQSIMTVSLLSMSEMLSPQFRSVSMGLYLVMQTLGMALVGIMGSYLNWRYVSLVISAPLVIVAILAGCMWPESPSWLAYKGEFDKCVKAFTRLRGTDDNARIELDELIMAQKENLSQNQFNKNSLLKYFWQTVKSRDFYLPAIHMYILLNSLYWTGVLVIVIYSSEIIQRATHTQDAIFFGSISLNSMMFVGCVTSIVLVRYLSQKRVFLVNVSCAVVFLLISSVVSFSQTFGFMSEESYISLYFIIAFMYVSCIALPIMFTITAELMPVKHRGVGGPLYVIYTCLLHWSTLKLAPYLLKYINLWGTLLLYATNGIISISLIWKFVPETKGKTLQQLEDFYAYGNMNKSRRGNAESNFNELMPMRT